MAGRSPSDPYAEFSPPDSLLLLGAGGAMPDCSVWVWFGLAEPMQCLLPPPRPWQVATEAFSVSNQTVQMFSEGIFAEDQADPTANR